MIRPFKDIKEFTTEVHKSLGSIIKLRYKADHIYNITGIITAFEPENNTITVGGREHCFDNMVNVYEYFNEDLGKWVPFGVEETNEPRKPCKFKVGKKYDYSNPEGKGYPVIINAKYKDPEDGQVKVVINGTTFSTVYTDEDGDERATFLGGEVTAENMLQE